MLSGLSCTRVCRGSDRERRDSEGRLKNFWFGGKDRVYKSWGIIGIFFLLEMLALVVSAIACLTLSCLIAEDQFLRF